MQTFEPASGGPRGSAAPPGDRGIDVILVDGEALLGPIETLDGWAVVATYFDDLERREHVDRGVGSSIEAEAGDTSLRQRLRGAVGSLFS